MGGSLPRRDAEEEGREVSGQRRTQTMANKVARYVRQVGRKAQKGVEPNDRSHDRKLEEKLKRMKPEEFDALLRDIDGET